MALQLKLDPTALEAGANRAKAALAGVKGEAVKAESAIDMLGREAARDLAPLASGAERAAGSTRLLAVESANLGRGGFAAGGGMRMLGQQLSQVAQQGAVTGNYLGALAVQLPDMALGFGSIAIAASIVATVALPLLIGAMGGGKTAAEQMADANDRLGDSISTLKGITTDFANGSVQALIDKYGQADTALLQLIGHQRDQAITEAQSAAKDAVTALTGEYGSLLAMIDAGGRAGQANAIQLKNELGLTAQEAIGLRDAMQDAQNATNFADQAAALTRIDAILATSTIKGGEFAQSITESALSLREVQNQAEASGEALGAVNVQAMTLQNWFSDATAAIGDMVASAPGGGWLSGAIGDAGTLAATLWNAAQAAATASAAASAKPAIGIGATAGPGNSQSPFAPPTVGVTQPSVANIQIPAIISGGGGGGGGGGAAQIDRTREAYDRLMASLDPVVARTQDMAKATETADAALAANDITAAEHAKALDLIRDKYTETADAMGALKDAGGNAIDGLINGTMNLSEALKQMAKDLIFATLKAQLLNSVTGAKEGMSLGGIIMQGLFGGFRDAGGNIPMGTTAMVGERGPELVTASGSGAMVTSRVDTARMMQGGQQSVHVTVGVSVDDDGKIKAYVKRIGQAAASAGVSQAVDTVKRNLAGWNNSLATDGALA